MRRLAASLRQLGDEAVQRSEVLEDTEARAMREFGEDNRGAARWLERLASAAEPPPSPEGLELDRIAQRVVAAQALADRLSIRIEVRVRDGEQVDPAQVALVRELCQTAPGVADFLLRQRCQEEMEATLARDLGEFQARGLIALQRDGGEIRCHPAGEESDAG